MTETEQYQFDVLKDFLIHILKYTRGNSSYSNDAQITDALRKAGVCDNEILDAII